MHRIVLALAFNLVGLAAIACDGPPVCTVVDPTGTPLNVRAGPNGAILSTLKRGAKVEVVEHKDHDGKRWALVGKYSEAWGYVFGAYLKCEGEDQMGRICTVADPTGTPLNIREEPNGKRIHFALLLFTRDPPPESFRDDRIALSESLLDAL